MVTSEKRAPMLTKSLFSVRCNGSLLVQTFGAKTEGSLKSFPVDSKIGSFIDFDVLFANFKFATSYLCRSRRLIGKMASLNTLNQFLNTLIIKGQFSNWPFLVKNVYCEPNY